MGDCSTNNCNPCGPDYNAINQLATKTAVYARQAKTSADNAENNWLEFNALYLGAFASAPTVDNEGNPLQIGALYWNSVSNGLFAWNGTIWVATNFNQLTPFLATGTTTARNLVTREADVFNVKDFGAVGDGIADDTAAIQAAVNAAASSGGGSIVFGRAHLMGGGIELASNLHLNFSGCTITSTAAPTPLPSGSVVVDSETISYGSSNSMFRAVGASNIHISGLSATINQSTMLTWQAASRAFDFIGCKYFFISGFRAIVPGAFVASRKCSYYTISDNYIDIQSTDGIAKHDGIIDQWWGSSLFCIYNNTIMCNGVGQWPILATATNSLGTVGTPMKYFSINNNTITNCKKPAIWAMGRTGLTSNFEINNNIIDTVEEVGIAITESDAFVVSGNIIRNTDKASIRAYDESGTTSNYAARNGVISNNVCVNANTSESVSSYDGSAIVVAGASSNVFVSENMISGDKHRYAVTMIQDAKDSYVSNGNYKPGVVGTINDASTFNTTNIYPSGTTWTASPTAVSNCTNALSVRASRFIRRDRYIEANGTTRVTVTAVAGSLVRFKITPPLSVSFSGGFFGSGNAVGHSGQILGRVYGSSNDLLIDFTSVGTGDFDLTWFVVYKA